MLKMIDTSKTLSRFQNRKCAELFCVNENTFTIVCIHCQIRSFEFTDFILHFRNVHLSNQEKMPEAMTIKTEHDVIQDAVLSQEQECQEPLVTTEMKYGDDSCISYDGEPCGITTIIDEAVQSCNEDESDEDKDDYLPILQKASPKKKFNNIFKCERCSKSYKHEKTLKHHVAKYHSAAEDFECTRCKTIYENEEMLKAHLVKQHSRFQCPDCDRTYKSRETLYIHKFNHSPEPRFKCDLDNCSKAFYNPKQLNNHKRIVHVGERNFVCEMCGFRTKNKNSLAIHNRSHTGERPYVCKTCSKGFASHSQLREHLPIHSTERPHVCDVCSAAFSRPKALYHHKHLHLAVKKFVCKVCGRAYAQAAGLSGHMRQHKAEQSF